MRLPAPDGIKGDSTADTTAVLLAAGAGMRLGRGPKALLPFRGSTLVEVLADVLLDGGCREVAVIFGAGPGRSGYGKSLDCSCTVWWRTPTGRPAWAARSNWGLPLRGLRTMCSWHLWTSRGSHRKPWAGC